LIDAFYILHIHVGVLEKYVAGIILIIDGSQWIAGGNGSVGPATVSLPPSPQRSALSSPILERSCCAVEPYLTKSSLQSCCVRGPCCTQHIQYNIPDSCPQLPELPFTMRCSERNSHSWRLCMVTVSQRTSLPLLLNHHVSESIYLTKPPPLPVMVK
jgi:hypothetical protein